MREERMAILNMLEKGIITVDEADRLLNTLHSGMGMESGITKGIKNALGKAGEALNSAAKVVGEQAEKVQPIVKNAAEKVADKADEFEPKARDIAFRATEKAHEFKDEVKNYYEKMKEKNSDDEDWVYGDAEEVVEDDFEQDVDIQPVEDFLDTDKIEDTLAGLQSQMDEINNAEDFLKAAFGDIDLDDWEDDDEVEIELAEDESEEEAEKESEE